MNVLKTSILGLTLSALFAGSAVAEPIHVPLPYKVEAAVEGHELQVEVDTGMIITSLPDAVVQDLKNKRFLGHLKLWTVGGETTFPVYMVPTIRVGNCILHDVVVQSQNTDSLHGVTGADGLLGRQALKQLEPMTFNAGTFTPTCH